MRIYTVAVLLLLVAVSCKPGRPVNKLLGPYMLPGSTYTIDITRDTVLHTAKGATIFIPAGSISAAEKTVSFDIREAFSMADIVMAGLVTTMDGHPLSSGGMISINPTNAAGVKILKAIKVTIPANYLQEGMQVYKGEQDKDGKINWKDPKPLLKDTLADRFAEAKKLFALNCRSCHDPLKDATGPALAQSVPYIPYEFFRDFTRNSSAMMADGDAYANCLYNKWNKTQMTAFPTLSDSDLRGLYDYLASLNKTINPANIRSYRLCWDSCRAYEKARLEFVEKRQELIEDNKITDENSSGARVNVSKIGPTHAADMPDNLVIPVVNDPIVYQFNIVEFGWYNVDMQLDQVPGFINSRLFAEARSQDGAPLNLYLIIPSEKIFLEGGPAKNMDDTYAFYTDDGSIQMPPNTEAFILAMSEYKHEISYGLVSFTTANNINITVPINSITMDQFKANLINLNFDDMAITAAKTKNADSIITLDKKLEAFEHLKPKNCDCNCGGSHGDADTGSLKTMMRRKI